MSGYKNPFSAFKILSQGEAEELLRAQPNKWNVVSISIPAPPGNPDWYKEPDMRKAKTFCPVRFHDITYPEEGFSLCTKADIEKVLNYTRKIKDDEPILIHCAAGISRSAAMGVLILLDKIKDLSEWPGEDAGDIVKMARKICMPNHYILNIGIPLIARDYGEQIIWFRQLYNSDLWR